MRLPNGLEVACVNRPNTIDLYEEIFVHDTYGRTGVDIKNGDVIFDIGANIGLFSLWVDSKADCSLHCYEPSPETFSKLIQNVPWAKTNQMAVTHFVGDGIFTHYANLPELSTLKVDLYSEDESKDWSNYLANRFPWVPGFLRWVIKKWLFWSQTFPVKCTTLAKEMESFEKIDLVKIDVEKSELDVLKGIGDANWGKIKQMIVECYGPMVPEVNSYLVERCSKVEWFDNNKFPELRTPLAYVIV